MFERMDGDNERIKRSKEVGAIEAADPRTRERPTGDIEKRERAILAATADCIEREAEHHCDDLLLNKTCSELTELILEEKSGPVSENRELYRAAVLALMSLASGRDRKQL